MRVIRSLLTVTEVFRVTGLLSFKRMQPLAGVVLILFLFSAAALAAGGRDFDYIKGDSDISEPAEVKRIQPGKNVEEDSETTFVSDKVITGDVTGYSEDGIEVDGAEYRICDSVMVFGAKGETISRQDIGAAETVKTFIAGSENCVRKIKILRAAH